MSDDGPWTIQRILTWTHGFFADKGIDSPRLDAELLLSDVLGCERIYLYTHFDRPLDEDERATYRALVKRRAAREPVSQLLGRREFFSREFIVTPDVLTPRPETEHLVEAVVAWVNDTELSAPRILDLGTGSGNIAVTLACELPEAEVIASDLSEAALAVARRNADEHSVGDRIELVCGDLFEPVSGDFDVIVSNPPYVDTPSRDDLMPEVRDYEPELALFAGETGLDVIERICAELPTRLRQPGVLVCELDPDQYEQVAATLDGQGIWTELTELLDLQQLRRAVRATR